MTTKQTGNLPSGWQPNKQFDIAFAIIRVDSFEFSTEPEVAIAVQKVVWSQKLAESEVSRLNKLNVDKDVRYFWQVARIERAALPKSKSRQSPKIPSPS